MKAFQITVLVFVSAMLAGCAEVKPEPAQPKIRIGDLVPPSSENQSRSQPLLKTINFDVYTFDIPSAKYETFCEIWSILYKPFYFRNYPAFRGNYFQAGLGQATHWAELSRLFNQCQAKERYKAAMMYFDGQPDSIEINNILGTQNIFYSVGESMTSTKIGPGVMTLQLVPQKIPGVKGACTLTAVPLFKPPTSGFIPKLQERLKEQEVTFTDSAISVKMSPGEFFVLGPQKYINNQTTLGSLFFSRPLPEPKVRVYVIVCTGIID